MARTLTNDMRQVMLAERSMPQFVIEIYDIRSGQDTIRDIIIENTLDDLTGPLNITEYVKTARLVDTGGDFTTNGVGGSTLSIGLKAEADIFSATALLDDPTSNARFARRGNFVRVREGDARVDFAEWPITFSGVIIGTPGLLETRTGSGDLRYTLQAVSREIGFLKTVRTSDKFGAGTTFNAMATDIAQSDMGLDSDEIEFSNWGGDVSALTQQLADQPPLVSIAMLMFVDSLTPRFDGEGKLVDSNPIISKPASWYYTDMEMFQSIEQPFTNVNPANVVIVTGLNDEMTEVNHPRQRLATLSITTGYFTFDESNDVYWSEDHRLLARNVNMEVRKAVQGGIGRIFGFSEKMELLPSEMGFSTLPNASVGCTVTVGTGFVSLLLVMLTASYLGASFIPDAWVGFGSGPTISIGRIIQALMLIQILLIMTRIGRGIYDFVGDPFEYVYAEISGEARVANIAVEDEVLLTIENHLLGSQTAVDEAARDVLFRKQAENFPRTIKMRRDLYLEVDDVFEIPGDRKFLITQIARTLTRGRPAGFMDVEALEITSGLQA